MAAPNEKFSNLRVGVSVRGVVVVRKKRISLGSRLRKACSLDDRFAWLLGSRLKSLQSRVIEKSELLEEEHFTLQWLWSSTVNM